MSVADTMAYLGILTGLWWGFDCWLWWRANR
jgi:hypothetical protein